MQGPHLSYLDGWRGLAIGFLLIGHFLPVPGINLGAVGVDLFFVLSGLFMARLLFIQEVPLRTFYRRRIARIFPATLFFLASIILLFAALSLKIAWPETWTAILFVKNYFPGEPGNALMPFGHIWSLSVEEHSYVLLSLLALAARRHIMSARTATAGAAMLCACVALYYWSAVGLQADDMAWLRTEVSAFGIFFSGFLAIYFNRRPVPKTSWLVVTALVGLGIMLHWWSVPKPFRLIFGIGAFALAVNLLEGSPDRLKKILSARLLRRLGTWSFSIYLWQQPFYLLVHRNGIPPLPALALALLFGVASFYCIEKPLREYLNRHGEHAGSSAAATAHLPDTSR
ncbi:MAG: acyltransferase family protein [Bacillota bacterium]